MIVAMDKVFIVAKSHDRNTLLETLRDLSVVHLSAVAPDRAKADEQCITGIDKLRRAVQILSTIAPQSAATGSIDPLAAADEVIQMQRESIDFQNRLAALHQKIDQLSLWGEVRLDQFDQLQQAGIDVRFYLVPANQLTEVSAECVQPIGEPSGKKCLIAIVDRSGQAKLPDDAKAVELPAQDRPAIRDEAAKIDQKLKNHAHRMQELAGSVSAMQTRLVELKNQADFTIAERGGFGSDDLFSVQGWIPRDKSLTLADELQKANLAIAVKVLPPSQEEEPPTLIRYPKWAHPIKGLFDILGTLPGYEEQDLSPFFMIALPIFAAMLIGDAGYGLVLLAPCVLFYRKFASVAGKAKLHLLMIVAAVTFLWGVITANYFGVTPNEIAQAGGFVNTVDGKEVPNVDAMKNGQGSWAAIGNGMIVLAPLWDTDPAKTQDVLIKLSLLIGCIHLTIGHLCRAVVIFPNIRALAELGWAIFLWAMFSVIWLLFFNKKDGPFMPQTMMFIMGGIGFVLFVLFTSPNKNPFKMIGLGFASSLLPILGAFSDTMSYIRLMAVGLASFYIAAAFNSLGSVIAESLTWFGAAPIVVFGHSLNLGLALIAVFAHGVRLNMLEFSSAASVQWAGYAFAPFAKKQKA